MSYPVVTLQKGKEVNAAFRHPWIFSGALTKRPDDVGHGEIVRVEDVGGKVIGTGTYSGKSSIAVRLLEFGDKEVVIDEAWFAKKFKESDDRRRLHGYGPGEATDGYRAVFGEADGLPGLVVDRYKDVLVLQISTAGMDARREEIVAALRKVFSPSAIIERSDLAVRKEEALSDETGTLFGETPEEVAFKEHGMNFSADVVGGQKTGFFLDQKSLRSAIARYAAGREVLNLFSYTGAAGVAAIKGGAKSVLNVDASVTALEGCRRMAELNGIEPHVFTTEESDAFQFLSAKTEPAFDMVLMDPPALIKSQRDGEEGKKAYHFLNRAALRLVRDGGVFVTSSCSHFLNEEDFAFTLRRASVQAGVRLDVMEVVRQAPDHPLSVYFPESAYLKSFICRVTR
ncbi:MAG TPA: class I SAM-dependent rRNA methyltransferase [Candidatus Eisenbacteria bacterium]|nr:class I SAM-dependent rRNA methyltransferase [Candidatus Eisenbacteria bacterium]